jgi:hypothetical protein
MKAGKYTNDEGCEKDGRGKARERDERQARVLWLGYHSDIFIVRSLGC